MSTVRRREQPSHTCEPPMQEVVFRLPPPPPPPAGLQGNPQPTPHSAPLVRPDGDVGDLWRCDDCGRLWRVGVEPPPRGGYSPRWEVWLPAYWWQRLRYRNAGRPSGVVGDEYNRGTQVIATRMADGYEPPSASLNPAAHVTERNTDA